MLIDWLRGRQLAADLLASISGSEDILAINEVSVAETMAGYSESEANAVEPILTSLEFWPLDYQIARLAGRLRYEWARRGRPLSTPDTLMAAHAISRDATLVTGNVRDFPMPEIKVLRLEH